MSALHSHPAQLRCRTNTGTPAANIPLQPSSHHCQRSTMASTPAEACTIQQSLVPKDVPTKKVLHDKPDPIPQSFAPSLPSLRTEPESSSTDLGPSSPVSSDSAMTADVPITVAPIGKPDEASLHPCSLDRVTEHLGPNGSLKYFNNKQGQKVAMYYWPAIGVESPRAVVHMLHGHGAYACFDYHKNQGPGKPTTYQGGWVETFNKAGYSVCAIDLHGAGRSDGLRCFTASFDHYVDEVIQSVRLGGEQGLPGFPPILPAQQGATASNGQAVGAVPRYLMGCSMGGCLATVVSMRLPDLISGVILLAPMLSLEKVTRRGINRYLKYLAPLVSGLFPTLPCVKVSKNTLYPDLQKAYDLDPNCWHSNTRARNGHEYVRVTHKLMTGGMEKVTTPFLVCHGLQDDMCDPDGSKALYDRAKSQDKTLLLLDQMWHILCREPGNSGLLADVLQWLDTRSEKMTHGSFPSNDELLAALRTQSKQELEELERTRPELAARLAGTAAAARQAIA